jgi:hypothetical protein
MFPSSIPSPSAPLPSGCRGTSRPPLPLPSPQVGDSPTFPAVHPRRKHPSHPRGHRRSGNHSASSNLRDLTNVILTEARPQTFQRRKNSTRAQWKDPPKHEPISPSSCCRREGESVAERPTRSQAAHEPLAPRGLGAKRQPLLVFLKNQRHPDRACQRPGRICVCLFAHSPIFPQSAPDALSPVPVPCTGAPNQKEADRHPSQAEDSNRPATRVVIVPKLNRRSVRLAAIYEPSHSSATKTPAILKQPSELFVRLTSEPCATRQNVRVSCTVLSGDNPRSG